MECQTISLTKLKTHSHRLLEPQNWISTLPFDLKIKFSTLTKFTSTLKKYQCINSMLRSKAYYTLHSFSCFHVFTSFFIAYLGCKMTRKLKNPIFSVLKRCKNLKTRVVCNGPNSDVETQCWGSKSLWKWDFTKPVGSSLEQFKENLNFMWHKKCCWQSESL